MNTKNIFFRIAAALMFMTVCNIASAQMLGIKTNGILLANLTPNISLELVTTKNTSMELTAFYSFDKTTAKTGLIGAQGEMRYWISGRPMNRLFVGLSLTALRYDCELGGGSRHFGDAIAPGVVYGYALPIGKHWNIEFATGLGVFWFNERRYAFSSFDKPGIPTPYNEHGCRILPNKLSVSCAYLF